jgi:hypothetical protein
MLRQQINEKPSNLPDDAFESVLEPLNCLLTLDLVACTDLSLAATTFGDTLTRTGPMQR